MGTEMLLASVAAAVLIGVPLAMRGPDRTRLQAALGLAVWLAILLVAIFAGGPSPGRSA